MLVSESGAPSLSKMLGLVGLKVGGCHFSVFQACSRPAEDKNIWMAAIFPPGIPPKSPGSKVEYQTQPVFFLLGRFI